MDKTAASSRRPTALANFRLSTPAILSALALAALALRLPGLGERSLWVDEAMSVVFAAKPLPELFQLLVTEDIHPPLYPLLLHYWMAVAGDGEFAVRLPSVFFGVLLVPLLYLTGRRLEAMADPKGSTRISAVGLVGALIGITSAFYIGYSQEARNYMAVTFMGMLSSHLLLVATANRRRRDWAAYALATVGAIYTHYTASLLLAFHLLFVLLSGRSCRGLRKGWILSILAVGLAYLPWLSYSIAQMKRISDYWPGNLQVEAAVQTSLLLFIAGGGVGSQGSNLLMGMGAALLALGLLALLLGTFRRPSRHTLFLLLYLLVPSTLLFAVAYYRPKYDPRYLLVVTPAFYLTLAWGVASLLRAATSRRIPLPLRILSPSLGVAALAAIVAASAIYGKPEQLTHVGDGKTGVQQYGDYRSLVAYLESRSQPGDGVVLMMNTYHPYAYYSKLGIPWYPMEPFDDFDGAIIRLNRMAEQHQRLWFILWQKEWADPADYVMHVMEEQSQEIPLDASFGGIGLRLFQLTPGKRFSYYPEVEHKKEALFGGRLLEFWGWNASSLTVRAGDSVRFDLHWRPFGPTNAKVKTKIFLMDKELRQWAVVDELMMTPFYPPSRWKEMDILHDRHILSVPVGTPPGSYDIQLLLYDENTMTDMPIERWSGEGMGTLLNLGKMEVTPTPAESFPPANQPAIASWELGGGAVELLSAKLDQTTLKPGGRTDLELLWRAPASGDGSHTLRVAFLDDRGNPINEQVMPLVDGYPTSRWRAGEPVRSKHWLTASPPPESGHYGVAVAVSDSRQKEVSALQYTQVGRLQIDVPKTTTPGSNR
ncbi:MAG: glycosyltransferase family 39 protein [Sphingomonadaceae bacterium]